MSKVWMPVEDDKYPMVENAENDEDFLYITGNTDAKVSTWVEYAGQTVMLDMGMVVCRLTDAPAPSIPADVRDTMRRSLVASESINSTDGWYKRMTAALAWLDATP